MSFIRLPFSHQILVDQEISNYHKKVLKKHKQLLFDFAQNTELARLIQDIPFIRMLDWFQFLID